MLKFVCWVICLVALIESTHGLTRDIAERFSDRKENKETFCDLKDLEPDIQCNEYVTETDIPENTLCWTSDGDLQSTYYRCQGNLWYEGSGTRIATTRRVRKFWGWVIAVAVIACLKYCFKKDDCEGADCYVTDEPPKFETCKPDQTEFFIEEEGATSRRVSWSTPTASDKEDGSLVPNLETSVDSGSILDGLVGGKPYEVQYKVADKQGQEDSCFFTIYVKAHGCTRPQWPSNGNVQCTDSAIGLIYGNTCTFSCNLGYDLIGTSETKCLPGDVWSHGNSDPTCQEILCPVPQEPDNGQLVCTDTTHKYLTTCSVQCNVGYADSEGVQTTCQDSGTWSSIDYSTTCKDSEPPTISCNDFTPQIFYADRSSTTTSVTWSKPTAQDNVDPNEAITVTRSDTNGPQQGESLSVGNHYVKYKATDSEGNESQECRITLRVEETICEHPLDVIGDNLMEFNCSDAQYRYGVSCGLSCQFNFPLVGADTITCERNDTTTPPTGYWQYTGDALPFCEIVSCPYLTPPINGALASETQNLRQVSVMACNDQYDIPYMEENFLGVFFCADSGAWFPYSKVPDCTEERYSRYFNLPGELFYTGNCSDPATQEQIKQFFVDRIASLKGEFDSVCQSGLGCSVEDVTVDCGLTCTNCSTSTRRKRDELYSKTHSSEYLNIEHERRKRRSAAINKEVVSRKERSTSASGAFVLFSISLHINLDGVSSWIQEVVNVYDPMIEDMKSFFAGKVADGEFNMTDFTLGPDAFQTETYADFWCPAGQIQEQQKCRSCPRGYIYDEGNKNCTECPVGQYIETDGGTVCISCPDGYSTKTTGSRFSSNCTKLCGAGTVSYDTMEPCQMCPKGQYQSETGQSQCIQCPSGQTTELVGSSRAEDCQDFDAVLTGEVSSSLSSDVDSLAVSVWFQDKSTSAGWFSMHVTQVGEVKPVLTLNMSETLSVKLSDTEYSSPTLLNVSGWNMVTIAWDATNGVLKLYLGGQEVINEVVTQLQSPVFPAQSALRLYSSGGSYVSGFSASASVPSETEVTSLMSTCSAQLQNSLMNMDIFLQVGVTSVSLVVPTSCDPTNECTTNPCGEHKCINGIGDYTCECSNRYTGKNCTIPPDHCESNQCQNQATCVNQAHSYTCNCPPGYTGSYCQVPPVDGGWGAWTTWSACDVTCGSGTQTRSRQCDSPVKDTYGSDCLGSPTETQACDAGECLSCPDIGDRPYGVSKTCNGSEDTEITCTYTCRTGKVLPNGLKMETYKCGKNTGYNWEPNLSPVSCTDVNRPDNLSSETTSTITPPIACSDQAEAETAYLQAVSTTACVIAGTCTPSVSISNCGGSASTTVSVTFVSVAFQETGDLNIDGFFENNIVSPAFQEWINIFNNMETTAQQMTNDSNAFLTITVNSVAYTVATSATSASVRCSEGYAATEAVCAPCSIGSRYDSGFCVQCGLGTYQDKAGQTECSACPSGYTTTSIGSVQSSDCSVRLIHVPIEPPTSTPDTNDGDDDDHHGDTGAVESPINVVPIIAACLGSVIIVTGIIAGCFIHHYCKQNTVSKFDNSDPPPPYTRSATPSEIHPKIFPYDPEEAAGYEAPFAPPIKTSLSKKTLDMINGFEKS